jgi:cytochrome c-type biogenesis protein CcmH/NrfG
VSRVTDPDRLAELEEERRFLLRSIDDLEREHDAGDVDDHDFATLRDGYVARAAAVLREIDEGKAALPPRRRRPGVIVATVVVTLAVAGLAGWMVAHTAGQRTDAGTGVMAPADEIAEQLSLARHAAATGDAATAITAYQRVLQLDPRNIEANTYAGWLIVTSGAASERADFVDAGIAQLRHAIDVDGTYTDAHCLLGVALARFASTPDPVTAKTELTTCLASDPPQDVKSLVQPVLAALG